MRTKTLSLAAAALFVTAGCSGITVHSSVTPGTNLAQYRTFSFFNSPYKQGHPVSPADQEIRASLRRDLGQKGLVEVTSGRPDFLVAYHTREQQELNVEDVGYGYWGMGGYPDITSYTEGTLIVDFVDPRTKTVFWRGTAAGVVDHPDNPDPTKLDQAVTKVINQYPSMVATTARPAM